MVFDFKRNFKIQQEEKQFAIRFKKYGFDAEFSFRVRDDWFIVESFFDVTNNKERRSCYIRIGDFSSNLQSIKRFFQCDASPKATEKCKQNIKYLHYNLYGI